MTIYEVNFKRNGKEGVQHIEAISQEEAIEKMKKYNAVYDSFEIVSVDKGKDANEYRVNY